jgi:hypothetical protein
MIPTLFGGALGFTMMAQYGRGEARLKEMTVDGGRYALMIALPLLLAWPASAARWLSWCMARLIE